MIRKWIRWAGVAAVAALLVWVVLHRDRYRSMLFDEAVAPPPTEAGVTE